MGIMRRLHAVYDTCRSHEPAWYVLSLLRDQAFAVLPIAAFIILFVGIFLQRWMSSTGVVIGGLLLVMVGLMFFLEGLRLYFVTLGENIGEYLPTKQSTPVVLLVAGLFGILVTYAEPATAALVPLGSLVDARTAPYVFIMLNRYREITVACIAIGVGFAAVIGTLRFLRRWPIKIVIPFCALPCLILSLVLMWTFHGDLRINIGLAWDCGAITGGPVTVPILLSMGVGVTRAHAGGTVSGCGIITLASLFPVFFVQLASLIFAILFTKEEVALQRAAEDMIIDQPPLQPLVSGVRSIIPLGIVLMLVWFLLVKRPLPRLTWLGGEVNSDDESEATTEGSAVTVTDLSGVSYSSPALPRSFKSRYGIWIAAFLSAQIGIILFNFGLSYGLVIQGANAGQALPAVYTHIASYWPSPRYSRTGGIVLVVVFAFCVGFLATLAEPALHIMGSKVKDITSGQVNVQELKYSVAVGVGAGTALGVCRVMFQVPLVYLIIPFYIAAVVLSMFGSEELVALAWDSAGVTTGEVSVPFILSLGLNFAAASRTVDGFGILTCASIGPVLSVLGLYYAKKWAADAKGAEEVLARDVEEVIEKREEKKREEEKQEQELQELREELQQERLRQEQERQEREEREKQRESESASEEQARGSVTPIEESHEQQQQLQQQLQQQQLQQQAPAPQLSIDSQPPFNRSEDLSWDDTASSRSTSTDENV